MYIYIYLENQTYYRLDIIINHRFDKTTSCKLIKVVLEIGSYDYYYIGNTSEYKH